MPLTPRRSILIGSATVVIVLVGGMVADSKRRNYSDRLPAVGAAVPEFNLPLINGGRLSSVNLRGQLAVLALWSTDCSASRLALDGLAAVQEAYAPRGVVVAILADDLDADLLVSFMNRAGVSLPVAYAEGELHALFDATRRPWQKSFPLPSFLVVDSGGRVKALTFGVPLKDVQSGEVELEHLRAAIDRVLLETQQETTASDGDRRPFRRGSSPFWGGNSHKQRPASPQPSSITTAA